MAHSSKIKEKNSSGNTLLNLAFQFSHRMLVEFLLGKGDDPTIENKARLTPLELRSHLGREYQFEEGW